MVTWPLVYEPFEVLFSSLEEPNLVLGTKLNCECPETSWGFRWPALAQHLGAKGLRYIPWVHGSQ